MPMISERVDLKTLSTYKTAIAAIPIIMSPRMKSDIIILPENKKRRCNRLQIVKKIEK